MTCSKLPFFLTMVALTMPLSSGPGVAVVGEGHRIVDRDFGDLRQHMAGRLRLRGRLRFGGLLRHCAVCQDNCQGKKQGYEEEPCFGHDATFHNGPWG